MSIPTADQIEQYRLLQQYKAEEMLRNQQRDAFNGICDYGAVAMGIGTIGAALAGSPYPQPAEAKQPEPKPNLLLLLTEE